MPLQLADLGYDVWMGNNRGTDYSLGHKTLQTSDREYWNWTWSEMGLYDTPANVKFIKENTKRDKIQYLGYSQGTVQMFYALAHIEESFLADSIIKATMIAPCSVSTGLADKDGNPDVAGYEASEWHYLDMGIYNVGGPDWDANLKKGCDTFGDMWCQYFSAYKGGIGGGDGQTFSVQDQMHWDFNYIQNRFQEWAPDYISKGIVEAPLIPIETIDKVPIAMIAST